MLNYNKIPYITGVFRSRNAPFYIVLFFVFAIIQVA